MWDTSPHDGAIGQGSVKPILESVVFRNCLHNRLAEGLERIVLVRKEEGAELGERREKTFSCSGVARGV